MPERVPTGHGSGRERRFSLGQRGWTGSDRMTSCLIQERWEAGEAPETAEGFVHPNACDNGSDSHSWAEMSCGRR